MLRLDTCCKSYRVGAFGGGELLAVRNVSFEVHPGEVVSLIGESGSGKSTIGKMILRLLRVTRGTITSTASTSPRSSGGGLKAYYGDVQGVFQDPFSSYNPIFKADRVFTMLRSAYFSAAQRRRVAARSSRASLDAVSLNPGDVLGKYPHQLSGGQLQRLLIARALLLDIRLLVADEIISMLDASTRIDVLNLLGDLKSRGLGILFITHDLSLGNYISDTTMILRRGERRRDGRDRRSSSATRCTRTRGRSSPRCRSCTRRGRRPRQSSGRAAGTNGTRPRPTAPAGSSRSRRTTSSRRSPSRRAVTAPPTQIATAAIPWEERPAGTSGVLWRSSRNPIVTRDAVPRANSIFNSAVVPFHDGFAGVFRVDDTRRVMNIHAGRSADGVDWDIDPEPIVFGPADDRVAEIQERFLYAYDPRVTWLEDRYYVTWCNGYHGPTIGIAYTDDFETFHQLDNAFLPFNRNGVLFPAQDRRQLRDAQPAERRRPHAVRRHLLLGEPRPRALGPAPARAWAGAADVAVDEDRRGPDADRDRRGLARPLPRRPHVVQRLRVLDGRRAARPRRAVAASSPAAATTCSRRRCPTSRSATFRTWSSRARRWSTRRPTASDLLRRCRHVVCLAHGRLSEIVDVRPREDR